VEGERQKMGFATARNRETEQIGGDKSMVLFSQGRVRTDDEGINHNETRSELNIK